MAIPIVGVVVVMVMDVVVDSPVPDFGSVILRRSAPDIFNSFRLRIQLHTLAVFGIALFWRLDCLVGFLELPLTEFHLVVTSLT